MYTLLLKLMVVNSYDGTFASRTFSTGGPWCDAFPIYGRAFACPSPRGNAKIDLRDTGFYIPDSVRLFIQICLMEVKKTIKRAYAYILNLR